MDKVTLKPCSGGHAPWVWGVTSTGPLFQAGCDKCREYGPKAPTDAEAIHAWNGWRSAMDKVTKVERDADAQWRVFELWFFRDISDEQRLGLIRLICGDGIAKECGPTHGYQRHALKIIRHRLTTRPATDLPEVGKLVERMVALVRKLADQKNDRAHVSWRDVTEARAIIALPGFRDMIERLARPVGEGDGLMRTAMWNALLAADVPEGDCYGIINRVCGALSQGDDAR